MKSVILLAHGGGGQLSREFIQQEILPRFGDGPLHSLPDAATLPAMAGSLRFATDSFVVQPVEFPGGNIGHLAVHGTVNDLAVAGGRPRWLALSLILEEGVSLALVRRVLDGVKDAADACGVAVVTGDTKVVQRGQCDGLYLNTAGIGEAIPGLELHPGRIREGDSLLVSGALGDHGMAVLAAREGLKLEQGPISDTRPLHRLVEMVADFGGAIRFMRDPTRGGLAALLHEVVAEQSFGVLLQEERLPFSPPAVGLAEMLGMDLLQVAGEGCLALFCAPEVVAAILERWRTLPEGQEAAWIGQVSDRPGQVVMQTRFGSRRLVDNPRGELLPRIC